MRLSLSTDLKMRRLAIAAGLGLCLAIAPVFHGSPVGLDTAFAKSEGKGGGRGGGNGGGGKSESGKSRGKSAEARSRSGGSANRGRGNSSISKALDSFADTLFGQNKKQAKRASRAAAKHQKRADQIARKATKVEDEADDKLPGKLNAAHASERARERAAPNSTVGQIAAYEKAKTEALATGNEDAIGEAEAMLRDLARKDLTADQIAAVDKMLGIEPPDSEAAPSGDELAQTQTDAEGSPSIE